MNNLETPQSGTEKTLEMELREHNRLIREGYEPNDANAVLWECGNRDAIHQKHREELVEDIISLIQTHTEHEGDYCDTGGDMEWSCRSKCVELAVERILQKHKSRDNFQSR